MRTAVYLVWYGGGIVGIYDNLDAARQVADTRNTYATATYGTGKHVLKARVESWDVQTKPMKEDL